MMGRLRGPRKVGGLVPAAEQERRALEWLRRQPAGALSAPSCVAGAIWPDHRMRAQGAAFAAGPVLARLKARGLVGWTAEYRAGRAVWWGWFAC